MTDPTPYVCQVSSPCYVSISSHTCKDCINTRNLTDIYETITSNSLIYHNIIKKTLKFLHKYFINNNNE